MEKEDNKNTRENAPLERYSLIVDLSRGLNEKELKEIRNFVEMDHEKIYFVSDGIKYDAHDLKSIVKLKGKWGKLEILIDAVKVKIENPHLQRIFNEDAIEHAECLKEYMKNLIILSKD